MPRPRTEILDTKSSAEIPSNRIDPDLSTASSGIVLMVTLTVAVTESGSKALVFFGFSCTCDEKIAYDIGRVTYEY